MSSIDMIVTRSNGAYTHDDVFELESQVVNHLSLMNYEKDCYGERKLEASRQLNAQ